jgi:hypothetical protein
MKSAHAPAHLGGKLHLNAVQLLLKRLLGGIHLGKAALDL